MKYALALAACFGIFLVYAIIAGVMGWKHGGGAIPMLILFAALIGTWRAIIKRDDTKVPLAPNLTNAVPPKNLNSSPLQSVVDEERIYTEIAKELEISVSDKGLWTRLFAECGGDEKQTKVLYIKRRADQLIASERAHLEQAAQVRAAELKRFEKLRLQGKLLREKLIEGKITKELSDTLSALSKTNTAVMLLYKVKENQLNEVDAMLTEEPLLVAVINSKGDTPLHIAVCERNLEMVQLLLEKGAVVEVKNKFDISPMDSANKSEQMEIVKLLLDFSS